MGGCGSQKRRGLDGRCVSKSILRAYGCHGFSVADVLVPLVAASGSQGGVWVSGHRQASVFARQRRPRAWRGAARTGGRVRGGGALIQCAVRMRLNGARRRVARFSGEGCAGESEEGRHSCELTPLRMLLSGLAFFLVLFYLRWGVHAKV